MALLRGKLFAGALFAGLLFGGRTAPLPPTSLPERPVWVKTHAPDQSATVKLPARNVAQTDWDVSPVRTAQDLSVLSRTDTRTTIRITCDPDATQAVQDHFQCGIFQHEIAVIRPSTEALVAYGSTEVWVVTAVKSTQEKRNQLDGSGTWT